MKDFATAKEVQPYSHPTRAMYVGAPGKVGRLRLGFELDRDGRSIMRDHYREAPLIVQRELYCDRTMPDMPVVYILSSGGPNVDGDRYEQVINLAPGTQAHITTGAGTKVAEMVDNYASMSQEITLGADSYLEYLPEPLTPCRHSRYITGTEIVADPTASMVYAEIYNPGRKYYKDGEVFAYDMVSATTEARRPDGTRLFREKFIIDPERDPIRGLGIMGDYDVFANVIVLAPPEKADAIYERVMPEKSDKPKFITAITRLPNRAGLIFKVLGMETEPVKHAVRHFASIVRQEIKGKELSDDFPWR